MSTMPIAAKVAPMFKSIEQRNEEARILDTLRTRADKAEQRCRVLQRRVDWFKAGLIVALLVVAACWKFAGEQSAVHAYQLQRLEQAVREVR